MNQKRELKIDFLRGAAIIAVVIGHAMNRQEYLRIPFNIIYSIHMPLLFFLSGYLTEQSRVDKYEVANGKIRFLSRKAISLLVPLFTWTIIIPWSLNGFGWNVFVEQFRVFVGIGGSGIWFLPVLFGLNLMYVLHWTLQSVLKIDGLWKSLFAAGIVEGIVLLFYMVMHYPYLLNMLSYFLPFWFGVMVKKYDVIRRLIDKEVILLLAIVGYFFVFPYFDFYNTSPFTQIKRIILSLFAIIILWKLIEKIEYENRVCRFVILCGKYSLAIYLIHTYLNEWSMILGETDNVLTGCILSILGSVSICIVCIAISKILECSNWLNMFMFGKYSKLDLKNRRN